VQKESTALRQSLPSKAQRSVGALGKHMTIRESENPTSGRQLAFAVGGVKGTFKVWRESADEKKL
jgi:hypothetical protein